MVQGNGEVSLRGMGATDATSLTRSAQRTVLPDDVREPPVFLTREERIRRFKLDVGVESLHWHDWCARPRRRARPPATRSSRRAG